MFVAPALNPVITPDEDPTEAIAVSAEVHVPPEVASLRVEIAPAHRFPTPDMAAGPEVMVTVVPTAQPELSA